MAETSPSEVLFTLIKTQVFTGNNTSSLPLNDIRTLQPTILRVPANGAVLKVYLKGREVGTVEPKLAAAITCLMDAKVCRTVGTFEFSPLHPNYLTCNISLFTSPQMIPVAIAILKLKGVNVMPAGQTPPPIVMSKTPAVISRNGDILNSSDVGASIESISNGNKACPGSATSQPSMLIHPNGRTLFIPPPITQTRKQVVQNVVPGNGVLVSGSTVPAQDKLSGNVKASAAGSASSLDTSAVSEASSKEDPSAIHSRSPVHVNNIVTLNIRGNKGSPEKYPENAATKKCLGVKEKAKIQAPNETAVKIPANEVKARVFGKNAAARIPQNLAATKCQENDVKVKVSDNKTATQVSGNARIPLAYLSTNTNVASAPREVLVKVPVISNAVVPQAVLVSTGVENGTQPRNSANIRKHLISPPGFINSNTSGHVQIHTDFISQSANQCSAILPCSIPGFVSHTTGKSGILTEAQKSAFLDTSCGTNDQKTGEVEPAGDLSITSDGGNDSFPSAFETMNDSGDLNEMPGNLDLHEPMEVLSSPEHSKDSKPITCTQTSNRSHVSVDLVSISSSDGECPEKKPPEVKPDLKPDPLKENCEGQTSKCGPFCNCNDCNAKAAPGPSKLPSAVSIVTSLQNDDVGVAGHDDADAGGAPLSPLSNSIGLLCGEGLGCYPADGSEDDVDMKPLLPSPPQAMSELDKLFESLKEDDKHSTHEPASVILTEMFPHQKQALSWMIIKERNKDLAPFWEKVSNYSWFNKGTKLSTDVCPYGIKGGILADDMGLGKTLTVIALIVTNHINDLPMFSKRETTGRKRDAPKSPSQDTPAEPPPKKQHKESSSDDCEIVEVKTEKENKKDMMTRKRRDEINNKKRLTNHKVMKQPGFSFRQMFLPKLMRKKAKKEAKAGIKQEKKDPSSYGTPPRASTTKAGTSLGTTPNTPVPLTPVPRPVTITDDDESDTSGSQTGAPDGAPSSVPRPNRLTIKPYTPNTGATNVARATLIVCPLSVLSNWTDQICTHVHPSVELRVYMYYGGDRIKDVKYLSRQDIVLTTYPTIGYDYRMKDSPLHKIKWLRIVLDEGHCIRNPTTAWTKAILTLQAQRKWSLTGTPIQNRIDDLYSAIRFLGLDPFNDLVWWKDSIASGIRRGTVEAQERLQMLIKHISIRRLKNDKTDDNKALVELPPRQVVIQDITLTDEERKIYDTMQNKGSLIIRGYLRHGTVLKNYAHCFAILMRLRQLCLHPDLVKASINDLDAFADAMDSDDDDDDLAHDQTTEYLIKQLLQVLKSGVSEECAICLEPLDDPVITQCAHVFCERCIMDVLENEGLAPRCPMCRAPVNQNELVKVPEERRRELETPPPSQTDNDDSTSTDLTPSAKITALMGALDAIRDNNPNTKSIVVSQFTSFLDILQKFLEREGFEFLRLDGTMTQEARVKVIEQYREPESPKIFLLSLTAGGVGLNLTAATRVFLMDPAWNPAVEEQCFDRCHRLGETEEVIVTKYIVMDSVEERMLSLQEEKRKLMTAAFGLKAQSDEDRRRARVRDIAHLIGIRTIRNTSGP